MSDTPLVKYAVHVHSLYDIGERFYRAVPFLLVYKAADLGPLLARHAAMEAVCNHIVRIMKTYHEQEARPEGVGTPGGLEHMGDVWSLLSKWEDALTTPEAK